MGGSGTGQARKREDVGTPLDIMDASGRMLKCAKCGSLVQDGTISCGVCGSSDLHAPDFIVPQRVSRGSGFPRKNPLRLILFLVVGITLFLMGFVFSAVPLGFGLEFTGPAFFMGLPFPFSPVNGVLTLIGIFLMIFGVVMTAAITGLFEGAPHHGRGGPSIMRADKEMRRREDERYSD